MKKEIDILFAAEEKRFAFDQVKTLVKDTEVYNQERKIKATKPIGEVVSAALEALGIDAHV